MRVLAVDDAPAFWRTIHRLLEPRQDFQLVGEASNGLEAVQKAEELQPDLIVLDIGLPKLNGIEAAKRISEVAPKSKIVFLTVEPSADVVQEAFRSGGRGYVLKGQAQKDLLAAVEAVLQGKQFVSDELAGRLTRRHEIQFYSNDASFLDGFTRFITGALKAGDAAIVIATEIHRDSIFQRLKAHGLDVRAAQERGSYISLDVADALSTLMVDDLPEPARFFEVANGLVSAASKAARGQHPHVAACGECAPVLLAQGNAEAAIRLEQLWDTLARTQPVDVLCGYSMTGFRSAEGSQILQEICAEHSAVHGVETAY